MKNKKVFCMKEAKKYAYNYWDGNRKFGYGGYKIFWTMATCCKKLIKDFKLTNNSRILYWLWQGYLLYELKLLLPKIKIIGIISQIMQLKMQKKRLRVALNFLI